MREWIYPYLKANKGRLFISSLFATLGVFSAAMLLFVSGYLISKSALKPENIMVVYVPIVAVRAFSIMQAAFPYLEKLVSHDIVLRILSNYRSKLYKLLEPQAIFLESKYKSGDILSTLSDDIEKLQDYYIKTFIPAIVGMLVYALLAIVLGFFDPVFMIFMLLVLGVMVFLVPIYAYRKMKSQHLKLENHRKQLYQKMTDATFGKIDWILSGRTKEVQAAIESENEDLLKLEGKIDLFHHRRDVILRFVIGFSVVIMLVWTGLQADQGNLPITLIAAFVLMLFTVGDSLFEISEAVEHMPVYHDITDKMTDYVDVADVTNEGDLTTSLIEEPLTIRANQVSFQYDSSTKVLNGVDFLAKPGEKIALLGKSGTGKSTFLKLLTGMIQPTSGQITLNGKLVRQSDVGKYVSVLNQKAHLFNTSILNNLKISRPDATEKEVRQALKDAQILDLIDRLPEGIHTQMREMGARFSGGEKQRIAFARVILQDTPIILMDEPTTGLDPETEKELLDVMNSKLKDKTVIWVTHHLVGAPYMDKIIFFEKGQIKFQGNHEALLAKNTYYKQLYEMDRQQ